MAMELNNNSVVPNLKNGRMKKMNVLVSSQMPVPLRILVNKNLIGVVMGPKKSTVQQIANETNTKIFFDGIQVKKNDNNVEIGLAIQGKPNNCSIACQKILDIIQKKQKNHHRKRSVTLRILLARCYTGRIVGKQYNIMRTIISQTETKITLSDVYDTSIPDRIITIEGSIEKVCNAEVQISKILRRSFFDDPNSMAPQYNINPVLSIMNPTVNYPGNVLYMNYQPFSPVQYLPPYSNGTHPLPAPIIQPQAIINPSFHTFEPIYTNYSANVFQAEQQPFSPAQLLPIHTEVTDSTVTTTFIDNNIHNYQPQTNFNPGLHVMDTTGINYAVPVFQISDQSFLSTQCFSTYSNVTNPILATNLSDVVESVCLFIPTISIKALVGITGSNVNDIVNISGAEIHILGEKIINPIATRQFCQKVNVVGTYKAQWEAQHMIFDTMWNEGYGPAFEEVILTVEIFLPPNQVHNIVDNDIIREMEEEMGCIISVPTNNTSNVPTINTTDNTYSCPLLITGGFIGTQLVQKRIRSILAENP